MSYKKYVDTGIDLKMFQKKQSINATHNKLPTFNINNSEAKYH